MKLHTMRTVRSLALAIPFVVGVPSWSSAYIVPSTNTNNGVGCASISKATSIHACHLRSRNSKRRSATATLTATKLIRTVHYHHAGRHIVESGDESSSSSLSLGATAKRTSSLSATSTDMDIENNNNNNNEQQKRLLGILVLLTVPLSWGTYAPIVKYVYAIEPPVPGFIFSVAYYLIASVSLIGLNLVQERKRGTDADADASSETMESTADSSLTSTPYPIRGGIELGSYLFFGNCLQVVGLATVPADRAAFLVQLTTIIVPFLQAGMIGSGSTSNEKGLSSLPLTTWIACFVAFLGVIVMELDGAKVWNLAQNGNIGGVANMIAGGGGNGAGPGDVLILLSAFAYSLHVVRLDTYAKTTTPLRLAACKATTEAVQTIALVFLLITAFPTTDLGSEIIHYRDALTSTTASLSPSALWPAIGACFWTGWVTCAYTIYAQSYGQRRVSPTDANLIYTTQPLFSALFAYGLLGERLGVEGFVGGAFIAFALWLVTSADRSGDDDVAIDANVND